MKLIEIHTDNNLSIFFYKLKDIVDKTAKHYKTDLNQDIWQMLKKDMPEKILWACGEDGTHLMTEKIYYEAYNKGSQGDDIYILNLKKLTITKTSWQAAVNIL